MNVTDSGYLGPTLLVLSVALLGAVGLLLFFVGKIVFGIAHYHLRERKPIREIKHRTYGVLKGEGELWSGVAQLGQTKIPFTVDGTEDAPDPKKLAALAPILARFEDVRREAERFLRQSEPETAKAELEVYSLCVWGEPDFFTLEFATNRDDGVWRVDFENVKPKQVGYDD